MGNGYSGGAGTDNELLHNILIQFSSTGGSTATTGGGEVVDLKKIEYSILELLHNLGVITKNRDSGSFLDEAIESTNPAKISFKKDKGKEINRSYINSLRDYLVKALDLGYLKDVQDDELVVKTAFQVLYAIKHGLDKNMTAFKQHLSVYLDGIDKVIQMSNKFLDRMKSHTVSNYDKTMPTNQVIKVVDLLKRLVSIIEGQKNFMNYLLRSRKVESVDEALETLAIKSEKGEKRFASVKVSDEEMSKLLMEFLNDLTRTGKVSVVMGDLNKVMKDSNLDLTTKTPNELKNILGNYEGYLNNSSNIDDVIKFISGVYEILVDKLSQSKSGGNMGDDAPYCPKFSVSEFIQGYLGSGGEGIVGSGPGFSSYDGGRGRRRGGKKFRGGSGTEAYYAGLYSGGNEDGAYDEDDDDESDDEDYQGSSGQHGQHGSHSQHGMSADLSAARQFRGGDPSLKEEMHRTYKQSHGEKINAFKVLAKRFNAELVILGKHLSELRKFIIDDNTELNESIERYMKKFLVFQTFRSKSMYLSLIGFFSDVQSRFVREDFLNKLNKLIIHTKMFKESSGVPSMSPALDSISKQLQTVSYSINSIFSKFKERYGGGAGDSAPIPGTRRISLVKDLIDIPDMADVNNDLLRIILENLYMVRLKNMRVYTKKFNLYESGDYEKLVGKAMAEELDSVREDYHAIIKALNKFEGSLSGGVDISASEAVVLRNPIYIYYQRPSGTSGNTQEGNVPKKINKVFFHRPADITGIISREHELFGSRDARAWDRNNPAWVLPEGFEAEENGQGLGTNGIVGEALQYAVNNYKEFFKLYYESYINLCIAAQGLDQYLQDFTKLIRKSPEIIEKLDMLLEKTNIGSSMYNKSAFLNNLLDIYDPNDYFTGSSGDNTAERTEGFSSYLKELKDDEEKERYARLVPKSDIKSEFINDRLSLMHPSYLYHYQYADLDPKIDLLFNRIPSKYNRPIGLKYDNMESGDKGAGDAYYGRRMRGPLRDGDSTGVMKGIFSLNESEPDEKKRTQQRLMRSYPYGEGNNQNFTAADSRMYGMAPDFVRTRRLADFDDQDAVDRFYEGQTDPKYTGQGSGGGWSGGARNGRRGGAPRSPTYPVVPQASPLNMFYNLYGNLVESGEQKLPLVKSISYHNHGVDTGFPYLIFTDETRNNIRYSNPINKMTIAHEFYKNELIIKNIVAIFFNMLKTDMSNKYMDPKAIYNALINYLSFGMYKIDYVMPTHGLSSENMMVRNIHGVNYGSTFCNDNMSVFNKDYSAMNLFDTNVRVSLVNVNDVDMTTFPETSGTVHAKGHNLLQNMIKSMIAKSLAVLGVYDINDYKNNRPFRVNLMDTTRVITGGDLGSASDYTIYPEAAELYVRLPLLIEFYKMIFKVKSNDGSVGSQVVMIPDIGEPFNSLFKHVFLYNNQKSVVEYSEMEMKMIIGDVNEIYRHFAPKAKETKSDLLKLVVYNIIEKINTKFGVLNKQEYGDYIKKAYEYLNLQNHDVEKLTAYDMVDDKMFSEEDNLGVVKHNLPSDIYSNKPELITSIDRNESSMAQHKGFSIKEDVSVLKAFRKRVFHMLVETGREEEFLRNYNVQSSIFGLDEILSELKQTLKESNNNNERKFREIFKLINSTSSFQRVDNMKQVLLYDFIVTSCNNINGILTFVERLRNRFCNKPVKSDSASIIKRIGDDIEIDGVPARTLFYYDNAVSSTESKFVCVGNFKESGFTNFQSLCLATPLPEFGNGGVDMDSTTSILAQLMLGKDADVKFTDGFMDRHADLLGDMVYKSTNEEEPALPAELSSSYMYVAHAQNLIKQDAFKLLRKLLSHPNLFTVKNQNGNIKVDFSSAEQLIETSIKLMIKLFGDISMTLTDSIITSKIKSILTSTEAKYENLFKSTMTEGLSGGDVRGFSKRYTVHESRRNIENFLNCQVSSSDMTEASPKLFSKDNDGQDLLATAVQNMRVLAKEFWKNFVARGQYTPSDSDTRDGSFSNVKRYNFYRLMNSLSQDYNGCAEDKPFPLDFMIQTKGTRRPSETQLCNLNDLIYAEPHPECFTTSGLFCFDIVSYFNHILSNLIKGCMSPEDKKIYKTCVDYINYTNDSLTNTIDNTINNIENIRYLPTGIDFSDHVFTAGKEEEGDNFHKIGRKLGEKSNYFNFTNPTYYEHASLLTDVLPLIRIDTKTNDTTYVNFEGLSHLYGTEFAKYHNVVDNHLYILDPMHYNNGVGLGFDVGAGVEFNKFNQFGATGADGFPSDAGAERGSLTAAYNSFFIDEVAVALGEREGATPDMLNMMGVNFQPYTATLPGPNNADEFILVNSYVQKQLDSYPLTGFARDHLPSDLKDLSRHLYFNKRFGKLKGIFTESDMYEGMSVTSQGYTDTFLSATREIQLPANFGVYAITSESNRDNSLIRDRPRLYSPTEASPDLCNAQWALKNIITKECSITPRIGDAMTLLMSSSLTNVTNYQPGTVFMMDLSNPELDRRVTEAPASFKAYLQEELLSRSFLYLDKQTGDWNPDELVNAFNFSCVSPLMENCEDKPLKEFRLHYCDGGFGRKEKPAFVVCQGLMPSIDSVYCSLDTTIPEVYFQRGMATVAGAVSAQVLRMTDIDGNIDTGANLNSWGRRGQPTGPAKYGLTPGARFIPSGVTGTDRYDPIIQARAATNRAFLDAADGATGEDRKKKKNWAMEEYKGVSGSGMSGGALNRLDNDRLNNVFAMQDHMGDQVDNVLRQSTIIAGINNQTAYRLQFGRSWATSNQNGMHALAKSVGTIGSPKLSSVPYKEYVAASFTTFAMMDNVFIKDPKNLRTGNNLAPKALRMMDSSLFEPSGMSEDGQSIYGLNVRLSLTAEITGVSVNSANINRLVFLPPCGFSMNRANYESLVSNDTEMARRISAISSCFPMSFYSDYIELSYNPRSFTGMRSTAPAGVGSAPHNINSFVFSHHAAFGGHNYSGIDGTWDIYPFVYDGHADYSFGSTILNELTYGFLQQTPRRTKITMLMQNIFSPLRRSPNAYSAADINLFHGLFIERDNTVLESESGRGLFMNYMSNLKSISPVFSDKLAMAESPSLAFHAVRDLAKFAQYFSPFAGSANTQTIYQPCLIRGVDGTIAPEKEMMIPHTMNTAGRVISMKFGAFDFGRLPAVIGNLRDYYRLSKSEFPYANPDFGNEYMKLLLKRTGFEFRELDENNALRTQSEPSPSLHQYGNSNIFYLGRDQESNMFGRNITLSTKDDRVSKDFYDNFMLDIGGYAKTNFYDAPSNLLQSHNRTFSLALGSLLNKHLVLGTGAKKSGGSTVIKSEAFDHNYISFTYKKNENDKINGKNAVLLRSNALVIKNALENYNDGSADKKSNLYENIVEIPDKIKSNMAGACSVAKYQLTILLNMCRVLTGLPSDILSAQERDKVSNVVNHSVALLKQVSTCLEELNVVSSLYNDFKFGEKYKDYNKTLKIVSDSLNAPNLSLTSNFFNYSTDGAQYPVYCRALDSEQFEITELSKKRLAEVVNDDPVRDSRDLTVTNFATIFNMGFFTDYRAMPEYTGRDAVIASRARALFFLKLDESGSSYYESLRRTPNCLQAIMNQLAKYGTSGTLAAIGESVTDLRKIVEGEQCASLSGDAFQLYFNVFEQFQNFANYSSTVGGLNSIWGGDRIATVADARMAGDNPFPKGTFLKPVGGIHPAHITSTIRFNLSNRDWTTEAPRTMYPQPGRPARTVNYPGFTVDELPEQNRSVNVGSIIKVARDAEASDNANNMLKFSISLFRPLQKFNAGHVDEGKADTSTAKVPKLLDEHRYVNIGKKVPANNWPNHTFNSRASIGFSLRNMYSVVANSIINSYDLGISISQFSGGNSGSGNLALANFPYIEQAVKFINNSLEIKINEKNIESLLNVMCLTKFHSEELPLFLTILAQRNFDPSSEAEKVNVGKAYEDDAPGQYLLKETFAANNMLTKAVLSAPSNLGVLYCLDDEADSSDLDLVQYKVMHLPSTLMKESTIGDEYTFYEHYSTLFTQMVSGRSSINILKNKDYLIRLNILDMNVMPININALSREIPLSYIYNYAASLDDYLLDMTEGSMLDESATNLGSDSAPRTGLGKILNLYKEKIKVINTGISSNRDVTRDLFRYQYDINKRELLRKIKQQANGVELFKTDQDRFKYLEKLGQYNAFHKILENIYTSTNCAFNSRTDIRQYDFESSLDLDGVEGNDKLFNILGSGEGYSKPILAEYKFQTTEYFNSPNKNYWGRSTADINSFSIAVKNKDDPDGKTSKAIEVINLFEGPYYFSNSRSLKTTNAGFKSNFYKVPSVKQGPSHGMFVDINKYSHFENSNNAFVHNQKADRNNTSLNAGGDIFIFCPLNTLFGISSVACGGFINSITKLPSLDMVDFLDTIYSKFGWGELMKNKVNIELFLANCPDLGLAGSVNSGFMNTPARNSSGGSFGSYPGFVGGRGGRGGRRGRRFSGGADDEEERNWNFDYDKDRNNDLYAKEMNYDEARENFNRYYGQSNEEDDRAYNGMYAYTPNHPSVGYDNALLRNTLNVASDYMIPINLVNPLNNSVSHYLGTEFLARNTMYAHEDGIGADYLAYNKDAKQDPRYKSMGEARARSSGMIRHRFEPELTDPKDPKSKLKPLTWGNMKESRDNYAINSSNSRGNANWGMNMYPQTVLSTAYAQDPVRGTPRYKDGFAGPHTVHAEEDAFNTGYERGYNTNSVNMRTNPFTMEHVYSANNLHLNSEIGDLQNVFLHKDNISQLALCSRRVPSSELSLDNLRCFGINHVGYNIVPYTFNLGRLRAMLSSSVSQSGQKNLDVYELCNHLNRGGYMTKDTTDNKNNEGDEENGEDKNGSFPYGWNYDKNLSYNNIGFFNNSMSDLRNHSNKFLVADSDKIKMMTLMNHPVSGRSIGAKSTSRPTSFTVPVPRPIKDMVFNTFFFNNMLGFLENFNTLCIDNTLPVNLSGRVVDRLKVYYAYWLKDRIRNYLSKPGKSGGDNAFGSMLDDPRGFGGPRFGLRTTTAGTPAQRVTDGGLVYHELTLESTEDGRANSKNLTATMPMFSGILGNMLLMPSENVFNVLYISDFQHHILSSPKLLDDIITGDNDAYSVIPNCNPYIPSHHFRSSVYADNAVQDLQDINGVKFGDGVNDTRMTRESENDPNVIFKQPVVGDRVELPLVFCVRDETPIRHMDHPALFSGSEDRRSSTADNISGIYKTYCGSDTIPNLVNVSHINGLLKQGKARVLHDPSTRTSDFCFLFDRNMHFFFTYDFQELIGPYTGPTGDDGTYFTRAAPKKVRYARRGEVDEQEPAETRPIGSLGALGTPGALGSLGALGTPGPLDPGSPSTNRSVQDGTPPGGTVTTVIHNPPVVAPSAPPAAVLPSIPIASAGQRRHSGGAPFGFHSKEENNMDVNFFDANRFRRIMKAGPGVRSNNTGEYSHYPGDNVNTSLTLYGAKKDFMIYNWDGEMMVNTNDTVPHADYRYVMLKEYLPDGMPLESMHNALVNIRASFMSNIGLNPHFLSAYCSLFDICPNSTMHPTTGPFTPQNSNVRAFRTLNQFPYTQDINYDFMNAAGHQPHSFVIIEYEFEHYFLRRYIRYVPTWIRATGSVDTENESTINETYKYTHRYSLDSLSLFDNSANIVNEYFTVALKLSDNYNERNSNSEIGPNRANKVGKIPSVADPRRVVNNQRTNEDYLGHEDIFDLRASFELDSPLQLYGKTNICYFPRSYIKRDDKSKHLRIAHILSRVLYNKNGFNFTFTRNLFAINFWYNLLRFKIKSESLYNTNKLISGKLFYQDEYDNNDTSILFTENLLHRPPRVHLSSNNYDSSANEVDKFLDGM
jgi:hypothetical protein